MDRDLKVKLALIATDLIDDLTDKIEKEAKMLKTPILSQGSLYEHVGKFCLGSCLRIMANLKSHHLTEEQLFNNFITDAKKTAEMLKEHEVIEKIHNEH